MLQVFTDCFSHGTSRTRIQLGQFGGSRIILFFCNIQFLNNLVFIFAGEVLTALSDDVQLNLLERRIFFPANLDEQTLLQTSGTDAGRVKVLNH